MLSVFLTPLDHIVFNNTSIGEVTKNKTTTTKMTFPGIKIQFFLPQQNFLKQNQPNKQKTKCAVNANAKRSIPT